MSGDVIKTKYRRFPASLHHVNASDHVKCPEDETLFNCLGIFLVQKYISIKVFEICKMVGADMCT
jgi:hypothetical protein